MQTQSSPLRLRCSGPLAIFTRPELKAERFSYRVPTPSAMRGLLEAILWKPAIKWEILSIQVLSEIRFTSFRRNEVNNRAIAPAAAVIREGGAPPQYFAEEDRAQRNTVALKDVDYLLEARFSLTPRANGDDSVPKFVSMFERRLEKGQAFQQPYFGCRECAADVRPPDGTERPIEDSEDFGLMLWDISFQSDAKGRPSNRPIFYWARMENGVIAVPENADAALASAREFQLKGAA